MSSPVSDAGLKEAIVHSVEYGAYPESEHVSSSNLAPSLLPALLADLQKARDEVKADICQLSREVAPDIDGWISQAKKLQTDIEHSKSTARDIVQQAEAGAKLRAEADEAANKARLLGKEVSFNEALVETFGQIKAISLTLDDSRDAIVQGNIALALEKLNVADTGNTRLALVENTRAYALLQQRSRDVKAALAERATARVRELVQVSVPHRRLVIHDRSIDEIDAIFGALTFLDVHGSYVKRLKRDLDSAIFRPLILGNSKNPTTARPNGNTISIEKSGDSGVLNLLNDLWTIFEYLHNHLPANVCLPLAELFVPQVIDDVTTTWLDPCVPVEIDQMPVFQQVLDRVSELAEQFDTLQWKLRTNSLREWVQSAPKTWHAKRREAALGAVRSLLFTKLRERKVVERVETQMVSKGDALMGGEQDADDDAWDAAWEEDETPASPAIVKTPAKAQDRTNNDDDDASAWDLDDDQADAGSAASTTSNRNAPAHGQDNADDDTEADVDAWGWGDEESNAQESASSETGHGAHESPSKKIAGQTPTERQVTLRESYTVTAVPDGILDIIIQSVDDAKTLTDSSYAHTPIGPAASALYTLPTFILAMYRATAATAYSKLDSGNMLIYNDSTRLADQLRSFIAQQAAKDESATVPVHQRPSSRLKLENDIKALDSFARRSYSTEMESQRTILNDMLDGAQGFINCTVEPYASACESAIEITASRLRDVYRQWDSILSRSALQQSLGSLLSTVTSKMILDVQDLSDVGDEESKKLKSFCDTLSQVKELFAHEDAGSGKHGDLTGIYCPNWFKFQYLGEILESSLADIKYLWIDGELRLEFDAEEVVDLVQALFADSDYRRKAIADIRRAAA